MNPYDLDDPSTTEPVHARPDTVWLHLASDAKKEKGGLEEINSVDLTTAFVLSMKFHSWPQKR